MLLFAVPGLLLVVVGYVVGYAVVDWIDGLTGGVLPPAAPEVVGWTTGVLLMPAVAALLVLLRRRRRLGAREGGRGGGHQK